MHEIPPLRNIGFLLKLINESIERKANHDLGAIQLTASQVSVLTFLQFRKDEKTTIRDIQQFLRSSHPTAAGLVKRLEQKHFVQTFTDPSDKRARIVCLDTSGFNPLTGNERPASEMDELLLNGLDTAEREQLHNLLLRVYANVKDF